jgi:glycosyltransferase involved in cell wall biosynthesis
MPRVSVIIPTYNRAHYIGETLRSILDQTFTDFEIVIVDDGSTDNTKEVVDSLGDSRIRYTWQENKGVASAGNVALKLSRGEYLAPFSSDDIWLSDNLETKVKFLDANPGVVLVCSDAYLFDNQTGADLGSYWHKKGTDSTVNPEKAARSALKYLLNRGNFILPQTVLMRRKVLAEVGYYDESLPIEDWDFFMRVTRRFEIATIDKPFARIRRHESNLSKNDEKMYLGAVGAIHKAIESFSLSRSELGIAKRRLARTHYNYGRDKLLSGDIHSGRQKLLAAIKVNPWYVMPYIYLGFSILGNRIILNVKSWKKRLS